MKRATAHEEPQSLRQKVRLCVGVKQKKVVKIPQVLYSL